MDHAEEIEALRCDECGQLKESTRPVRKAAHNQKCCYRCWPPTSTEIASATKPQKGGSSGQA
jgi:hypothetical protein